VELVLQLEEEETIVGQATPEDAVADDSREFKKSAR
jgi:hypothetical protein